LSQNQGSLWPFKDAEATIKVTEIYYEASRTREGTADDVRLCFAPF